MYATYARSTGTLPPSQADGARAIGRAAQPTSGGDRAGPLVVVCASGRGGAGTTLTSMLLALAAAGEGHRTVLVDGDELVGPHALAFAVPATWRWRDLRQGVPTNARQPLPVSATLSLIAGGRSTADADAPPLSDAERRACFRRVHSIARDAALIVIDAGAHVETVLAALEFDGAHAQLLAVVGDDDGVALAATHALVKLALARSAVQDVGVCVTRRDRHDAARIADTLADGARRFLQRTLPHLGTIPADPTLAAAIRRGMPVADAVGGAPAALAALDLVNRLLADTATHRLA